jgi:hypothetical protein
MVDLDDELNCFWSGSVLSKCLELKIRYRFFFFPWELGGEVDARTPGWLHA